MPIETPSDISTAFTTVTILFSKLHTASRGFSATANYLAYIGAGAHSYSTVAYKSLFL